MWEQFFDFLFKVLQEFGFSVFVIVLYTLIWPYMIDRWAKKLIKAKNDELKRMAAEKQRWEEIILGEKRRSSKSIT